MVPIDTPPELRYLMDRTADDASSALDRLFAGSALRQGLDELLVELAQVAREEEGHSWADVGRALDITKQAAQQRFGRREVITVSPEGDVTVTKNRERYESALRDALLALGDDLPEGVEVRPIEIEVPVEMPVEVRVVKKKVVKKSASKTKSNKKKGS
jgi:hypothetical protein